MARNKDRISEYLVEANKGILFDELSDDYLAKAGVKDILHGVPVPLIFDDEGMSTLTLALGMARIVGGDINFRYADEYMKYIKHVLGEAAVRVLLSEGVKRASEEEFEIACMFFRAALVIEPESCDALYLYGRSCKDAYEAGSEMEREEAYVGNFKAESLEVFEILTMLHKDFAMGYYFLGYGYLNLGLYTKAKLTWDTFMELTLASNASGFSEDSKASEAGAAGKTVGGADITALRDEIAKRLESLGEPVEIENACNMILGGNYQGGLAVLESYSKGRYSRWWPMWYYIGIAKEALSDPEGAISAFKQALKYSPSNTDVMRELVQIYEAIGDEAGRSKYAKKIDIILENCQ